MKNYIAPFFGLIAAVIHFGCNPACETAATGNVFIQSADAILSGRENEILLRSVPPNFLVGRKVFMDDPVAGGGQRMPLESFYAHELSGLIVTIPEEVADVSSPGIYVDDPDCSSSILYVSPVQIRNEDFFFFSELFIMPPMPIVMIPTVAVAPPGNITNAWITPYERGYCMWFVPERDASGRELSQLREYRPMIDEEERRRNPTFLIGSREFVVCELLGRHKNADHNPVSGFVDKANNIIEIKVDRTSKGLEVEFFDGLFISPDRVPDTPAWRNGHGGCNAQGFAQPSNQRREDFMLLTSRSTGLQVLLIQATGS